MRLWFLLICPLACLSLQAQIRILPTYSSNIPSAERVAMEPAVERAIAVWERYLHDPVDIRLEIDWDTPSSTAKATSFVNYIRFDADVAIAALRSEAGSERDFGFVATLPADDRLRFLLNLSADNPNGNGSATPYLDDDSNANNLELRLTFANAKSLGLRDRSDPAQDGRIRFNGTMSWDFDSSNGVNTGDSDFETVLTHEIGHILGFTSRIDSRLTAGTAEAGLNYITMMDLLVFSADSRAEGLGVFDWTLDTRPKYISFDGGSTPFLATSLGVSQDGFTRGHWQNAIGASGVLGIMDPSTAPLQRLLASDLAVLDAIGWDVLPSLVGIASISSPAASQIRLEWIDLGPVDRYEIYRQSGNNWLLESGGSFNAASWTRSLASVQARNFRVRALPLDVPPNAKAAWNPAPIAPSKAASHACGDCACRPQAVDALD